MRFVKHVYAANPLKIVSASPHPTTPTPNRTARLRLGECKRSYAKLGTRLGVTRAMAKLLVVGDRQPGIKTARALGYQPITIYVPLEVPQANAEPAPSDEELNYS